MRCPHCGAELQEHARFCLYCMVSLEEKTELTPPSLKKKSWKNWLPLALCLLLLAGTVTVLPWMVKEEASSPMASTGDGSGKAAADERPPEHREPAQDQTSLISEETEAPTAQPGETRSSSAEAQSECPHLYREATCIAPMTCLYCGVVKGLVSEEAHAWQAVTTVVYHEEVGHYEEVFVRYDSVTKYDCGYCSAVLGSYDELVAHFQSAHSNIDNYEWHLAHLDDMCDVIEAFEPVYETRWIVDQPAYEENLVTGRSCSLCGKEE